MHRLMGFGVYKVVFSLQRQYGDNKREANASLILCVFSAVPAAYLT